MKKRIVEILTNGFKPDVRVYKEAVYMIQNGYDVTILCWDREPEDELPSEEVIDGIRVVRFRIISAAGRNSSVRKLHSYYRFALECKKYIKKNHFDYIHCNDNSGALVGLYANKSNIPMIVDMHEFFEQGGMIKKNFLRQINLLYLRKSVAGIYENPAYLGEPYKDVRDRLIPLRNYPDSSMVKHLPKEKSNVFRIGFHGWVRPRMIEFEALFEAVNGMDDVRVDINGGGPGVPIITELAKKYSNVHINGSFDGTKELTSLYQKTDLVFCGYDPDDPNYQGEAEIVKFYEAIVTGTPMLMTESIGMGEKVRKNSWGLTCDTRSANEIRQAVIKLKDDKTFWQECSDNELESAPLYSWENAVKRLDEI